MWNQPLSRGIILKEEGDLQNMLLSVTRRGGKCRGTFQKRLNISATSSLNGGGEWKSAAIKAPLGEPVVVFRGQKYERRRRAEQS